MKYKMDLYANIIQGYNPSTIFVKKKLHLICSTEFEYDSADSKPLLTFSKSQAADLFANKVLLAPFQNR